MLPARSFSKIFLLSNIESILSLLYFGCLTWVHIQLTEPSLIVMTQANDFSRQSFNTESMGTISDFGYPFEFLFLLT